MGADRYRSPDAVGVQWFFFLRTSSPLISPQVYTVAMTTSRAMTTPTTPPEFRVSKATSHVPTHMIHLRVNTIGMLFLLSRVFVEVVDIALVVVSLVSGET